MSLAHLWVFVCIVLPAVAALESKLSTIDLAYQIRAGDIMLRTHSLIRTDTFSFTAAGHPWIDQQWGAQILFAWVYRLGGWPLLAILRAGLVGLVFGLVYLSCRESRAGRRLAAGLTIASFFVAVGALALRPQLLGMVLFAVTVWILARRRRSQELMWAIPPIVALWSNLHGSFFMGPVLVGLAALQDRHERSPLLKRTMLVGLTALAATVVNPLGFKVWAYVVSLSTNPNVTDQISEWQPPVIRGYPGASFFVSVAAVVAVMAVRRRGVAWPTLVTLGTFFLVGLLAVRGIFWWAVIAPPALASTLDDRPPRRDEQAWSNHLNTAIAAALVGLGVLFLPYWRPVTTIGEVGRTQLGEAPPGLVSELRAILRPGERFFSPQILGSWFELELPGHPVTVDARIEIYPDSVWRQYLSISQGREGWQEMLDRWHVRVLVADRQQQKELLPRIETDPAWRLAYKDEDGLIFVHT